MTFLLWGKKWALTHHTLCSSTSLCTIHWFLIISSEGSHSEHTCISSLRPAVGEGLYSEAVREPLFFFFGSKSIGLPVPGSTGVPHVWYTYVGIHWKCCRLIFKHILAFNNKKKNRRCQMYSILSQIQVLLKRFAYSDKVHYFPLCNDKN